MKKTIFIHGWATDSWVWKDAAQDLCSGGGDALLLDLPGHGGPGRWLEPSLNPALTAADRALKAEEGPLIGIGWSLGAKVLLGLAARMPEKFSALVLVGATPSFVRRDGFEEGQPPALVRRMIMDMKKNPEETLKRFYPLSFTEKERAASGAAEFMKRYAPPGPLVCEGSACRQAFSYGDITAALEALYNTDIRGIITDVRVPALVVHGGADEVVPPGAGEFLAARLPQARLSVFPSAGHAPFITEKERFIETVKDFLGEVKAGPEGRDGKEAPKAAAKAHIFSSRG